MVTDSHPELPREADLPERVPPPGRTTAGIVALVAVGGALGTLARDGLEHAIGTTSGDWPTATLVINVAGSFLLGLLLELLSAGEETARRRLCRYALGTGVLGGFTTYSTLATETALLGHHGHWGFAVAYPILSVIAGFLAAAFGVVAGRWFDRRRLSGA